VATMASKSAELSPGAIRLQLSAPISSYARIANRQLLQIIGASTRFTTFEPEIESHLQCSHCWIDNKMQSRLNPMPGTAGEDMFRCDECFEISTPG